MTMKCPFCFSKKYSKSYYPSTLFNGKIFNYLKCKSCNLIYLDSFPDEEDLELMYPPSYQAGILREIMPDPYKKLIGLRFSYGHQFDLIKKHSFGTEMLDYGCGNAHFLLNANFNGFKCDGVEYNPKHVSILRNEIPESSFYTVDEFFLYKTKTYDIIRLSNVLEHLTDPHLVIEQLVKKLNNDGILIVEGPIETNFNVALLTRKLYFKFKSMTDKNYGGIHKPTHIFFSNSNNQKDFFKKHPLVELHFEINESAWPYPWKITDAKGLGGLVKFWFGQLSIFLSKFNKTWGNTFLYIGKNA